MKKRIVIFLGMISMSCVSVAQVKSTSSSTQVNSEVQKNELKPVPKAGFEINSSSEKLKTSNENLTVGAVKNNKPLPLAVSGASAAGLTTVAEYNKAVADGKPVSQKEIDKRRAKEKNKGVKKPFVEKVKK